MKFDLPDTPVSIKEIEDCNNLKDLAELIAKISKQIRISDSNRQINGRFSTNLERIYHKQLLSLRAFAYEKRQALHRLNESGNGMAVLEKFIQLANIIKGQPTVDNSQPVLPPQAIDFNSREMQLAKEAAIAHMNKLKPYTVTDVNAQRNPNATNIYATGKSIASRIDFDPTKDLSSVPTDVDFDLKPVSNTPEIDNDSNVFDIAPEDEAMTELFKIHNKPEIGTDK